MKTIFIVNPKAGQGKNAQLIISKINSAIKKLKADAEIYVTKCIGDAEWFVKNFCERFGNARFIACGGDGTLSEVLNGAIGYQGVEIGVIPNGTGNDFCRNFDCDCNFQDIASQITEHSIECDAIRYTAEFDGTQKRGYAVNMFNIGFDCNVADLTQEMKQKPFISGSLAYFVSIFITLIKKKGADLKIEIDGKIAHNGKLLLTSLANGSFCGGGIKSNPLASIRDGLININIIKNVSRLKFISLLPSYMKGTVLDISGIEKYITSQKCRKVTITPKSGKMRLCIDGEITDAEKTHFEIVHNAFRFVVPKAKIKNSEPVAAELI